MISEIEKLKKNHKKIAIIMLDEDNVELTDALFDCVSRE